MPDGVIAPPAPAESRAGELTRRAATFRPATFDAEARTAEVVFTTGADVKRHDWWNDRYYLERLRVTPEAVNLTRLNAGAPVLNTHSQWDLADVIGVVERAWIENGEGIATIRFSEREEVAPIIADIEAGIIRNISVGYWKDRVVTTQATDGSLEIREAVEWTPGEISFVPVPADPGAQIRSAGQPPVRPALQPQPKEARMSETITPPGITPEQRQAEMTAAREAETTRIRDITTAARSLGIESEATAFIQSGATLEAAQKRFIEIMVEQRGTQTPNPAQIQITRDEGDTARRALGEALMHRAGVLRDAEGRPAPLPEASRQYRGLRLLDFAAESIRLGGGKTQGMMPAEIARAALGNREFMARSGIGLHSVSDFPNLLANTASKAMGQGYGSARRTFTAWARKRTLPDFKSFRVVNLSGAPLLTQISAIGADAGEIEFGTIGEGAESYQLARYGKRIAVTYEAIVNDDMDGFSRLPQMFGTSGARLESTVVYGILNANPNMADGNALFSTAHNNVFGTGSGASAPFNANGAVAVAGLGLGRQLVRTQTAPNGDIIDLTPRFILVPAGLETVALQFTSQAYIANQSGSINPFAQQLTPIVEPRLTSQTQWYLLADNGEVDTLEYGYLEGQEEPLVTSYVDEDTDGVIVKCTHNFGAKATDFRGMVRSTGT